MKRFFPVIIFIIFSGIAWEYGYNRVANNPDPNHTHADFAVWLDGNQIDFSVEKYMSKALTPAEEEALAHETGSETLPSPAGLRKYLHLHDGNGHVIHRHKPGLTLGDFFWSLGISCRGTDLHYNGANYFAGLYVNGKQVGDDDVGCNYNFHDGDHLLITNAMNDPKEIQRELSVMTDDACRYSLTCPGRGKPPTESCIADPTVPCKAP